MKVTRADIIAMIVIPILIITSIVIPAYFAMRVDRTALRLECLNAVSNVAQLRALASLEDELGIPVRFEIPEVPKSCVDLLGH